jgi:hypothetical protein
VFALPQATLRSPAVMKIKPFGHSTSKKDLAKKQITLFHSEKNFFHSTSWKFEDFHLILRR